MVSALQLARARQLGYGDALTLHRETWRRVPAGFEKTRRLTPGTVRYREDRPVDPLVIDVRSDRIRIRRERYHPRYHPTRHLVHDHFSFLPGAGRPAGPTARAVALVESAESVDG